MIRVFRPRCNTYLTRALHALVILSLILSVSVSPAKASSSSLISSTQQSHHIGQSVRPWERSEALPQVFQKQAVVQPAAHLNLSSTLRQPLAVNAAPVFDLEDTATITVSSTYPGFSSASAADGNTSTEWATDGDYASSWIQFSWGTAQTIHEVRLLNRGSDSWGYPRFTFANNDFIDGCVPTTETNGWITYRFRQPHTTTSLRVSVNYPFAGSNKGFKEVEINSSYSVQPDPDDDDLACPEWFTTSSSSFRPYGAIDNDLTDTHTTIWASNADGSNSWIQFNYRQPVTINKVSLYGRVSDQWGIPRFTFSDSTYVDGTTAVSASAFTTYTFAAKTTTSLKISVLSGGGGTSFFGNRGFVEARVYGGVGDAPPLPRSQAFATNECPFCNNASKVYTTGIGINAGSGNYNHQHTDGQLAGAGARLALERSYNSLTSGANSSFPTYNDVLGYGWTHNYNVRLILPADTGGEPGVVQLIAPRGSIMRFDDFGDGTYTPFPAVLASLTRTGSSGSYEYQVVTNSQYEYVFNNDRQLVSIFDPQDRETTLSYSSGKLSQVQDASGSRRLKLYYSSSRLDHVDYVKVVSSTETTLATSSYTYDGSGNLDTVTDMDGRVWDYVYATASNHLLTEVIDPSGKTLVETTFDSSGRVTLQEDGSGHRIAEVLSYASDVRQIRTDSDDNDVVTTVTFAGGVPVSVNDPNDNDAEMAFVGQGINPGLVTDPNGNETALTWSAGGGNLTQVEDALGNTTDLDYDSLNNLTEVTDDLGRVTKYEYVSGTTLLERTIANYEDGTYETSEPENDLITAYTYTDGTTSEPAGLVRTVTDPRGIVTRYTYTALGQQATVTVNYVDGTAGPGDDDLTTSYTYDDRGRLLTITDPLGRVVKNEYDADGNLFRITRNFASGQAQNYQNTFNLITEYTFDDAGRVLTVTDTLGRTDWTCYDDAGRVVRSVRNATGDGSTPETDPCDAAEYEPGSEPDEDRINTTEYDGDGNVIATIGPDGVVIRTYYDDLNRPVATIQNLTDPINTALGSVTAWSSSAPDENVRTDTVYDPAGNVQKTIDNAGRVVYNCYDALNRVVRTVQNPSVSNPCGTYTLATETDEDLIFETVYDAVGNAIATIEWGEATSASDPDRRITRTYYDGLNRPFLVVRNLTLQAFTDPEPPDDEDFPTSAADENLATQTFYDKAGRVFKTLDLNTGRADWTCYDDAGRVTRTVQNATGDGGTAATDPCDAGDYDPSTAPDEDLITDTVYDAAGRSIATIAPDEMVTRTYYDAADRPVAVTANLVYRIDEEEQSLEDALALTAPPTYDGENYTDENLTTEYTYDPLGRVVTTADNAGLVTYSCYDALGRSVKSIQNPTESNPCSTYTASIEPDEDVINETVYDGAGNAVASIDPAGIITRTYYDALHRTRYVVANLSGQSIATATPPAYAAPDGNLRQELRYDAAGRVYETVDNSGMVTRTSFDALDRGTSSVVNYVQSGPADSETNLTTGTTYDKWNNVTDQTDAEGVVTHFEYDLVSRLVTVIENYDIPANMDSDTHVTTHYAYDWHDNRLSIQDANAVLNEDEDFTLFTYDALDRMLTETDPLDHTTTYTYTKAGTTATLLDAEAQTTTYEYDGLRRLATIDYPSGTNDVGISYDAVGNRKSVSQGDGEPSVHWAYDALYQPSQIDQLEPTTDTVEYTYDKLGLRQSLTYPDGKSAVYNYDGLNRLTSVTPSGSGSWGSAGATEYSYTNFGGQETVELPNGVTATYTYNDAHRLTQIEYETSSVSLSTFTYTLDKVGNRIAVTEAIRQPNNSVETVTIDYEYDSLYRLTLADYSDGRYFEYTYDAVGNRLSEEKCLVTSSCTPITTTYDYDIANRLTQVNSTTYTWDDNGNLLDDGPNTYTYDAANRLTSFNDGTTNSTYTYNGLGDRHSQTVGSTTTNYVLDLNAGLTQVLSDGANTYLYGNTRIGELQSGSWAYHLGDALGSVRQLADGSAVITLARNFEPYGNTLTNAGTGTTMWQFTGESRDASGLTYLRARYLSTAPGRFFQHDPWSGDGRIPGTLHPYLYGLNNPIRYADPSGRCIWDLCILESIGLVELTVATLALAGVMYYGETYSYGPNAQRNSTELANSITNLAQPFSRPQVPWTGNTGSSLPPAPLISHTSFPLIGPRSIHHTVFPLPNSETECTTSPFPLNNGMPPILHSPGPLDLSWDLQLPPYYLADTRQWHHIATDKHETFWTKKFETIFALGRLRLKDKVNIVLVERHKGKHPDAYHQWVYDRLVGAIKGLTEEDEIREALIAELTALGKELKDNPKLLNGPEP